uniref:Sulfotransferase n=1 Tax=Kalanchoe fedtschenkoi TaxID=63787 RepID=A0A7N0SXL1_KALFE
MEQTEKAAAASAEETSQKEFDSLIESLPKIPNWARGHCYKYEGFWYWEDVLRPILSCKKHFRARDSDVILSSFPKCGTTWLKAIVYTIVNRDKYPIGSEDHPLLTNNPHALIPGLEWNVYYANNAIPDISNVPAPRLLGTHSPALSLGDEVMRSGCKIIYICRNIKDCFISFWDFVNKFKTEGADGVTSLDEVFGSFCSGEDVYGPFWDHFLVHWKLSLTAPERLMFLTYEQISEQPNHYVKKIAEFLGCPFSDVEEDAQVVNGVVKMCSFNHLSQLEVNKSGINKNGIPYRNLFRRGQVGDSKNFLSPEMMDRMDCIAQEKFSPYGLKM